MKKNKIVILLIAAILLLSACESTEKKEIETPEGNKIIISNETKHKHCTRKGSIGDAGEVKLNYDIYYTGEILNSLRSEEQIISNSKETLDKYEEAYRKIHVNYEGLDHYDTSVVRTDTTVTSIMVINYDMIDIEKILAIEGEENNIIENGKAKVQKWLDLAKKFGTECEDVED